MITKSRHEIIKRTMDNLNIISRHNNSNGQYDVTQLINSFLMTILQNWDDLKDKWPHLPKGHIKWPGINSGHLQPHQSVGKMRDALAHGNFVYEGPEGADIEYVSMWTCQDKITVDWHMKISVSDMRSMLECFVAIAETCQLEPRVAKVTGQKCR